MRVAAGLLLLAVLASCEREQRATSTPRLLSIHQAAPSVDLAAGGSAPMQADPRGSQFEGNAFHLSEGERLYEDYNCSACHAHGGGDIGPALMDSDWIYGGRIEQIVATIVQGRPNGMPSYRNLLTDQQIWEIAAYVRAMSGNVPRDAAPSRGDTMSNTQPLTLSKREKPTPSNANDPRGAQ